MSLNYEPSSEQLHISAKKLLVNCSLLARISGQGRDASMQFRAERELFIGNLLVLIHVIIVMIRRPGLASWEFECPSAGSLTSTVLAFRASMSAVVLSAGPRPSTPNFKPTEKEEPTVKIGKGKKAHVLEGHLLTRRAPLNSRLTN
jgi:hypothetical protein